MNYLANMQIVTNEVSVKNNNLPVGDFSICPQFSREIGRTEDGVYFTELSISLKNTEEVPFPFDIFISITGYFDFGEADQTDIDNFMKEKTVHILFPYLRTILSTVTSSAMIPPVVLPIMDVSTLFPAN